MKTSLMKTELTEARRRLVELMQWLNFGRIEGLQISGGQPVFQPLPRVIREYKLAGENGPRVELTAIDFALKSQVIDLFHHFDELANTTIEVLEIKHGLPFRMLVTEPAI
jgi:hypothetical protein